MKKYLQVFSGGFSNLDRKIKRKTFKNNENKKNRWDYYRLE